MKQHNWQVPRRIELEYEANLYKMVAELLRETKDVVSSLLTVPEWLEKWSYQAAQKMVTGVLSNGAKTWRLAAQASMRGPEMYYALQEELSGAVGDRYRELIEENAKLIRTLPREIAQNVTLRMAKNEEMGERANYRIVGHLTRVQARLLARTETSKATTALTQARSESLGIEWYIWETSHDERVRLSHKKLQGVLINFDEPPSPEDLVGEKSYGHYQAGNIFNCRCYPAPLIRFDDVNWPHRVYTGGKVRTLTLAAFKHLNRNTNAAFAA